jgi:hypothetical protein
LRKLSAKTRLIVLAGVAVLCVGTVGFAVNASWNGPAASTGRLPAPGGVQTPLAGPTPSATAPPPDQSSAGKLPGAPKAPETAVNNQPPPGPEVKVMLCMLTRQRVSGLLGPNDGKESADQRIRNAVQSLEDSLETWRYVAQTEPAVGPLVTQTEKLAEAWRTIVKAYDSGNKAAARSATAQADKLLAQLPATPPPGAVGCPA